MHQARPIPDLATGQVEYFGSDLRRDDLRAAVRARPPTRHVRNYRGFAPMVHAPRDMTRSLRKLSSLLKNRRRLELLAYRATGALFGGLWRAYYLKGLELPSSERPLVSVIIPTYGQLGYTAACLRSIMDHPPKVPIEVIVVEDHSGDRLIASLAGVPGLRYLENPENLGFLRSCNRAATLIRGQYLYLLNNDAEVTEGWLDALVDVFKRFPDCGLAGSKLVFPDGRLQEAGGFVGDDASALMRGKWDDPAKPEYNYLRDADYISGASILVPRELWVRLAGFDEGFAPAYYEDADLAFRLRQAGFRVIYQPASVVIHHGGVSYGAAAGSPAAAYSGRNQARMKEKWRSVLRSDHDRKAEHGLRDNSSAQ